MRFFIELSYNGKAYHGWQIQPNATSVQEVLEKGLSTLLRQDVSIVGAGRTDTGVHAKQMYAHFDVEILKDTQTLVFKLNSYLPKDIVVKRIFQVHSEAHARFDAVQRTYNYRISTVKNAFNFEDTYTLYVPLDIEAMEQASEILRHYKDFQCFSKSNTDVKTYNCDITAAFWTVNNDELVFEISANRFLRNMVRAIVGTLVNIGMGKLKPEDLHQIIKSKDRSEAGFSVPAKGLYLTEVKYPETIKQL